MIRADAPVVVGLLVLSVFTSPATAANREQQQLMADIRMLQEQTQQLQQLLGTLGEGLKAVSAKMDEQSGINRKAVADQRLLVETLSGDVRIVREKIDDTNVRISGLSQELEALRLAIPPASAPMSPTTDLNGMPDATGAQTAVAPGVSPQRLYDTAWADYAAGQWALAISGFQTYIKTFPRSELADEAQFYIGQSYYSDGKFKEAVAAFDQVLTNYKDSNSVAEAAYKKGLALDRLGQPDRAKEAFELVVKSFPNVDVAILARQQLEKMARPTR